MSWGLREAPRGLGQRLVVHRYRLQIATGQEKRRPLLTPGGNSTSPWSCHTRRFFPRRPLGRVVRKCPSRDVGLDNRGRAFHLGVHETRIAEHPLPSRRGRALGGKPHVQPHLAGFSCSPARWMVLAARTSRRRSGAANNSDGSRGRAPPRLTSLERPRTPQEVTAATRHPARRHRRARRKGRRCFQPYFTSSGISHEALPDLVRRPEARVIHLATMESEDGVEWIRPIGCSAIRPASSSGAPSSTASGLPRRGSASRTASTACTRARRPADRGLPTGSVEAPRRPPPLHARHHVARLDPSASAIWLRLDDRGWLERTRTRA